MTLARLSGLRAKSIVAAPRSDSGEGQRRMTRGPKYLRDTANIVLEALVRSVQTTYGDRPLTAGELRKLVDDLKKSDALDPTYAKTYGEIEAFALAQANAAQRVEVLHRIVTHPLDKLLDSEDLSREALPNFFNSLRLMLGDEVDALQQRCVDIHDDLKGKLGDAFTWDVLYADNRAKLVLYEVLTRIADTFKRFDARRDWFIGVMQYAPATIGIASNAYVNNPNRDSKWIFGPDQFRRMFQHLFTPVASMSAENRALFTDRFGKTPDEIFTPLFRNLG
jgi:hypothetical protein